MSFQNAYKASKIIETIENYAVSDVLNHSLEEEDPNPTNYHFIESEEYFWPSFFKRPDLCLNQTFEFRDFGLSEWIARVPGLFFHPSSQLLQKLAENQVEYVSDRWKHYSPIGKSQKVLGGIGTINLPPNENGWYIASISGTNNASTGIPVLIREEVWDHHKLQEGKHILWGKGRWMKMDQSWSQRFPSILNIPRAYLRIDKPDDLIVEKTSLLPTVYHPFSIMSYEKDNGKFLDYVYLTVDSSEQVHRKNIVDFFDVFRNIDNRNGVYLIEPYISEPILSNEYTLYHSPFELRESTQESSHLSLLVERVKQELFNGANIDSIKIAIDNHLNIDQLRRLSDQIEINPNKWFKGGSVQNESASFIETCLREGKLEEFVDTSIDEFGNNWLKL